MGAFIPFSFRAWVKRMNWKAGTLDGEGAVVDGDTAHFLVDRGMYEYQAANCRFWGVKSRFTKASTRFQKSPMANRPPSRLPMTS